MLNWYLKVVRNYAYFGGRARRAEFWYFTLVNLFITIAIQLPGTIVTSVLGRAGAPFALIFSGVGLLYGLAVLVPSVAVSVRRLHDTGRTGWWIFIALIPVIGALVLIYFYVLDSDPNVNRWGPNPKEATAVGQSAYAIEQTP